MKRVSVGLSSAGLMACLVVLGASCGPAKEATTVTPLPVVTAAPSVSAAGTGAPAGPSVDLHDPASFDVGGWTDDEVVMALAQDCNWDPGDCLKAIEAAALVSIEGVEFAQEGAPPPGEGYRTLPPAACQGVRPLACAQTPGQSCAPDECSQTDYDCVPACDKGCSACAGKCVEGCQSCKSACKDEACKLTCAESCAECHQSCLQALDTCASAHCSEESENCFKTRDDEWNKSACPKVCDKVQKCVDKCPEIENDYSGRRYGEECATKCFEKLGKGCPSRFNRICAGDPNAGVNFFAYHTNRADAAH